MNPSSSRPTWAEIDLNALAGNYLAIRKRTGRPVMGIVKANGYGHGAVAVARTLSRLGAPIFGVATVDEGAELRAAGLREPVLVLGCVLSREVDALFELGLSPQITDIRFARELSRQAARRGQPMSVHLKVDTGMRRCGVPAPAAVNAAVEIAGLPWLKLEGVMTHFPCSDELDGEDFTRGQIEDFRRLTEAMAASGVATGWRHAANSGAVLGYPESWFDMARPGMILYGCYPSHDSPRTIAIR
ncbi:MAG TPA: alanine racemase [Candidatus Brocadiia bacterium]|nr:alanine racemase [Candidatus Brocadiia bacterium]